MRARFFIAHVDDERVMRAAIAENQLYQDLVFVAHAEHYRSIALKSLSVFRFATRIRVRFVHKCDDDSYPRIPHLLQVLRAHDGERTALYMGEISERTEPQRAPGSKWYMPVAEYAGHVYPPFAHGAGYVLSRALFTRIVAAYQAGVLRVLPLEDVTVAVWVDHVHTAAGGARVTYVSDRRFSLCCCQNDMLNGHYIDAERMRRIFARDAQGVSHIC